MLRPTLVVVPRRSPATTAAGRRTRARPTRIETTCSTIAGFVMAARSGPGNLVVLRLPFQVRCHIYRARERDCPSWYCGRPERINGSNPAVTCDIAI